MTSKPLALKPSVAVAPRPIASVPTSAGAVAPRPVASAGAVAPRPVAPTSAVAPRPAGTAPASAVAPRPVGSAPTAVATQQNRPPIVVDNVSYRLFSTKTRDAVDNLAILKDKVIKLDYWVPSLDKKCIIGVNRAGDKYLVLNDVEYTSKIQKCSSVAGTDDLVVETEYSVYIIAKGIATKTTTIGEGNPDDTNEIM